MNGDCTAESVEDQESGAVRAGQESQASVVGRGMAEGSKRTRFQKGRSGNPTGRPKGVGGGHQTPRVLLDLRRVYRQPPEKDCTPAQPMLRKWLNAKPIEFFDLLRRLEQDAQRETR